MSERAEPVNMDNQRATTQIIVSRACEEARAALDASEPERSGEEGE